MFLVVVAPAPSARADDHCEPHVRLESDDAELIGELGRALEARGIRTTSADASPADTDEAWGCEELAVQVVLDGRSVSLTTRDSTGLVRHRTVRTTATAVALMESWLMRGVGVALPGTRPDWWLTVRGEGAGAQHARWDAGVAATLGLDMWREVLLLELTLQTSLGSREEMIDDRGSFGALEFTRAPVGGVTLLSGPAIRVEIARAALWLGVAVGARALLSNDPYVAPVFEPMVALTLPVERDVELELRSAVDITVEPRDNGSPDSHWVVRGSVGLRWGVR